MYLLIPKEGNNYTGNIEDYNNLKLTRYSSFISDLHNNQNNAFRQCQIIELGFKTNLKLEENRVIGNENYEATDSFRYSSDFFINDFL